MTRKIRSDIQVENLETKLGIPEGSFRNDNGRKTRSDKTLGAIREEKKRKG